MRKYAVLLLSIVATCTFQSCKKINGDGPVVTETRYMTGFHVISSSIDGDIHFTPSAGYSMEIRAQQNILDIINTRVRNGELIIEFDDRRNIGRHAPIDVYIAAPGVDGFDLSGSGNMNIGRTLNTGNVSFSVSGSGSVNASEIIANSFNGRISGSGDININNGIQNVLLTTLQARAALIA